MENPDSNPVGGSRTSGHGPGRHRRNLALAQILLWSTGILPFLISARRGLIDPFTHGFVVAAIRIMTAGHLGLEGSSIEFAPGSAFLLAESSQLLGVAPEVLEYLPITGLLALVSAYALAVTICKNEIIALLFANVAVYRFFGFWLYSVWPHAFGFALFLLFIAIMTNKKPKPTSKLAVLWLLFMTVHVYSYTAELWIVVLMGTLLVIARIQRKSTKTPFSGGLQATFSPSLFLASLVGFLGMNQVVYGGYLPRVVTLQNQVSIGVEVFLAGFLKTTPAFRFGWVPQPSPVYLTALQITWYGLTILPLAYVFRKISKTWIRNGLIRNLSSMQSLLFAFVIVWLIDVSSYLLIGGLQASLIRLPTLVGPFATLAALPSFFEGLFVRRSQPSRIRTRSALAYAIGFLLTSVGVFGFTVVGNFYVSSDARYLSATDGAIWLLEKRPDLASIFSDQNTQGHYGIVFAYGGRSLSTTNLYDESSFSHLADPKFSSQLDPFFAGRVIVINKELWNRQTTAGGWRDFEPIQPLINTIDNNINLRKVYDDGTSLVYYG
jgi:hypothetical protein